LRIDATGTAMQNARALRCARRGGSIPTHGLAGSSCARPAHSPQGESPRAPKFIRQEQHCSGAVRTGHPKKWFLRQPAR